MGRLVGFASASIAALFSVLVLAGCGGGGNSNEPTAAELYAQQIQVGDFTRPGAGVDPDEQDRSSADVTTSIRPLGKDRYQLTIQNFSNAGFINSFWWSAGKLMRITAVTGSSGGSCHVSDPTTVQCTGLAIRPPKCTCEPGGSATVTIVAKTVTGPSAGIQYGVQGSKLKIGDVTPVPYHIPSYKGQEANADLPICAKGQASTKSQPCVHAT